MYRKYVPFLMAILLLSGLSFSAIAQDDPKQEKPKAQEEAPEKAEVDEDEARLLEISNSIREQQAAIVKELRETKRGSAEYSKLLRKRSAVPNEFADEVIELVEKKPGNTMALSILTSMMRSSNRKVKAKVADALFAAVKAEPKGSMTFSILSGLMNDRSLKSELNEEAKEYFLSNFRETEMMAMYVMRFSRGSIAEDDLEMLETLIEESEIDAVKAACAYALGKHYSGKKGTKEKGQKYLKSIVEDYPDVKVGSSVLAKAVEGEIFEAERLQIGMEVPDIEGEDIDGEKFKLSDYRGKVVVLDFWGDW